MRLTIFCVISIFFFATIVNAQYNEQNYYSYTVDKRIDEFPNKFDLNSPLNSFITFKYLQAEGKTGLYRNVNSYRIKGVFPKPGAPDVQVNSEKKAVLLNTKIREIIIYKDSVAGVISDYSDSMCIITYLSLEDGKWLNAGEDLGNNLDDARRIFKEKSPNFLDFIYRIMELKTISPDTVKFVRYLEENGSAPKDFILRALSNYRIVIYGEIHRRKTSWNLMKDVIISPNFAENVGTVFMELSSDKQDEIDIFFNSRNLDSEILLNIFRDVQLNGWYDKGMHEFLIELWKLNQNLPEEKRIYIVCVDEPRPFSSFSTREEMDAYFKNSLDRNEQMANIISKTISANNDKRNNLFIVGNGHAYKSQTPGFGVGRPKDKAKQTAASQLSKIFGENNVFSIFQHCPVISNNGTMHGLIRNGLYDFVFSKNGGIPVAFNLGSSPFGKEPFDGLYEITYDKETGSFNNNYDAYIFLEPLEVEQGDYLLEEIITDKYVEELKRRAKLVNTSVEKWFGVKEGTKEAIIEKLRSSGNGDKKRWNIL